MSTAARTDTGAATATSTTTRARATNSAVISDNIITAASVAVLVILL